MAQDETASLVSALYHASALQDIQVALRRIKAHIIGHEHRKEAAVKAGIIQPLVKILSLAQEDSAGDAVLTDIISIFGILASAGRQVVKSLLDAQVDKHIVQTLAARKESVTTHACVIALESISSARPIHPTPETQLDLQIITTETASILRWLLSGGSSISDSDVAHFESIFSLITNAAVTDEHKTILLTSGVLDILGEKFAVRVTSDLASHTAAPGDGGLLRAICAVIEGSCYRSQYFIHLPAISRLSIELAEQQTTQLPEIVYSRNTMSRFPVSNVFTEDSMKYAEADSSHLNTLTSILLILARKADDIPRYNLLRLIGLIEAAHTEAAMLVPQVSDLAKARHRERQLALLAIPLCIAPVDLEPIGPEWFPLIDGYCSNLALLIAEHRELQNAAVQAGAIKMVCAALKTSFAKVVLTKPLWTPHSAATGVTIPLGDADLPAKVMQIMNRRRNALMAIAAIAHKDEDHRKSIVMAGAITHIIEALKPMSRDSTSRTFEGSTTAVLLAACQAVKNISRSVANLRTSLIDGGVTTPIFELLRHPDVDVQIAATDVCINFVLDTSPMREDLVSLGIIKILAENAKQGGPAMRLSSIWACKHLLLRSDSELKTKVTNELGLDFVMMAAQGLPPEEYYPTAKGSVALNSANAAGEQVDLLNPLNMDVDGPYEHTGGEDDEYGDEDGEWKYDDASKTRYHDSSLRSTLYMPLDQQKYLATLKQAEDDAVYRAKREDIAIQEQALDFIRNLVHGEDCSAMLDKLFAEIGVQRIWDLLLQKISPIPGRQRLGRNGEPKPVYHPTEIVASAIHVMNHIANSNSAHKELIANARPLLRALVPHLERTAHGKVKIIALFAVIAMIWVDDSGDRNAARRRANELRLLGIETAVKRLANDTELDVRERVKVAVRLFDGP